MNSSQNQKKNTTKNDLSMLELCMLDAGTFIRELRQEQHLTQEELSFLSGVSVTHISQVENHKKNISVTKLNQILTATNALYTDLIDTAYKLDDTTRAIMELLLSFSPKEREHLFHFLTYYAQNIHQHLVF